MMETDRKRILIWDYLEKCGASGKRSAKSAFSCAALDFIFEGMGSLLLHLLSKIVACHDCNLLVNRNGRKNKARP